MKRHAQFESINTRRDAARTKELIADLDRLVQVLNVDIAVEERDAGISDRSKREYPILARNLAARRDNLLGTMAALRQRLSARSLPEKTEQNAAVGLSQGRLSDRHAEWPLSAIFERADFESRIVPPRRGEEQEPR
jgi:hypothetical protein